MTKQTHAFNAARRRALRFLGLGAVAAAFAAPTTLFARQFVGATAKSKTPNMVYDPDLQMLVDPLTREPVYEDAKRLRLALPCVTAGCSDCPKRDDPSECKK